MKTSILSACACFAVALLCFGFLWWNSGTTTRDPVQVVKVTPCQYRSNPSGKPLSGIEVTYQSLNNGRLYLPTLCASNPLHLGVGDDVVLFGNTVPGYSSPPSGILTLIGYLAAVAVGLGLWLIGRMLRASRKTNVRKE